MALHRFEKDPVHRFAAKVIVVMIILGGLAWGVKIAFAYFGIEI